MDDQQPETGATVRLNPNDVPNQKQPGFLDKITELFTRIRETELENDYASLPRKEPAERPKKPNPAAKVPGLYIKHSDYGHTTFFDMSHLSSAYAHSSAVVIDAEGTGWVDMSSRSYTDMSEAPKPRVWIMKVREGFHVRAVDSLAWKQNRQFFGVDHQDTHGPIVKFET